ncbi:Dar gtpase 2 protein [Thalictrum thalictroides]|uniref:Dar gtpase 2 protein n=1 Tax=Thalictrum thalictroides TaxID=46969 RepID=A0A7J6XHP1_THATH|nr:Dar gtpase 2 protein [Thalictrum thalictroides]
MATASRITERIGAAVMKAGANKASTWFTPHMAAASRAIFQRIPSVDFILEVRDARIPISSQYEHMRHFPSTCRIIILNKMDLANRSQTQSHKPKLYAPCLHRKFLVSSDAIKCISIEPALYYHFDNA